MKKRIISAFAALLMLFSVLALAVSADNGQLKLSKPGRITAGSTFTLTMKLAGIDTAVAEQGIVSVSFDLAYDHSLIETSTDTLGGTGFDGWEATGNVSSSACTFMVCDFEGKNPLKKADDLTLTLVFTVPASAAGQDVVIEAQNVSIVYGDDLESIDLTGVPVDFTVAKKSDVSTTVDGITYLVDDDTASVASVANKSISDLVIPASISYNGKTLKVTSVEGGAFADLSAVKTAYIPCTVTAVPSDAFDGNAAVTLKGCKNSAAYKFAMEQGFEWAEDTTGYTEKIIRESTCTIQGASQLACPNCGAKTGSEKTLPLADHKYGEWVVTKEATNDEDGSRERVCSVCGAKDTEVIHRLDCKHENKKDVIVKEATCAEVGSKNVVCADCGKVLEENIEVPKTAHTFGEWVVTKEATVKDKGTREHTCTVCGTKETEEIDKLGCKHVNTTNGHKDPTCTADGSAFYSCSTCGGTKTEKLPATGHQYGEPAWTWIGYESASATFTCANDASHEETVAAAVTSAVTKEPTCTEDGLRTYTASVTFGEKNYTDTKTEGIKATGEHVWDNGVVTTEPTCTAKGVKTYTCAVCHATKTEEIPAKGHTEVEDPAVASTCQKEGLSKGSHCSVCNKVLTERKPVAKRGHSLVELPREEPTCDKPGHTSGMSCTMCGAVVFGHTEIPALGHRMENGVCKVCGYVAPTEEESTPENKTGNDG